MLKQPKHPAKKPATVAGLEGLSESDWEELVLRLSLYAETLLRRSASSNPLVLEAQDFVLSAMEAWLTGRREKPEGIDLFTFLTMVIRSSIAHEFARLKRRNTLNIEDIAFKMLVKPMEDRFELDQALKLVEGDELFSDMIKLLFEDPELRAHDLAAMLGVPIRDIYQAMRRMRRRLSQLRSQETNPRAQGA